VDSESEVLGETSGAMIGFISVVLVIKNTSHIHHKAHSFGIVHCAYFMLYQIVMCYVSCDGSFNADMSLSGESVHLEPESLNIGGGVQVIHHDVQGLSSKLCEVS